MAALDPNRLLLLALTCWQNLRRMLTINMQTCCDSCGTPRTIACIESPPRNAGLFGDVQRHEFQLSNIAIEPPDLQAAMNLTEALWAVGSKGCSAGRRRIALPWR